MSFEAWKSAVANGETETVRSLLAEDPEIVARINERVFSFDSPAVFQCRDNLEMIDVLLQYGADLNQKTGWLAGGFGILEGVSPEIAEPLIVRGATLDIWPAVGLDQIEIVRNFLNANPDLIRATGGDGKHPLHYAHSVEMVDLLVNAGADVNARDVDHTSTPIQYLINEVPVVRRLLALGAKPDIFIGAALGDSTIVAQCLSDDPSAADARLGFGTWKNDGNIYHWTLEHDATPQDVARIRGHLEVLQLLLAASSVDRQLTDAIWNDESELIEQLLEKNPAIINELSFDSQQMLPRAAWWYRPAAVRWLLELGFDPHVTGAHKSTPLDRAAFHGYADIVEMLLTHDPNPPIDHKNEFGSTPLGTCIYAFRFGWQTGHPQDHYATIKLLLEAGARRADGQGPVGDSRIDELLASY